MTLLACLVKSYGSNDVECPMFYCKLDQLVLISIRLMSDMGSVKHINLRLFITLNVVIKLYQEPCGLFDRLHLKL